LFQTPSEKFYKLEQPDTFNIRPIKFFNRCIKTNPIKETPIVAGKKLSEKITHCLRGSRLRQGLPMF
jgi:hypothetical protein